MTQPWHRHRVTIVSLGKYQEVFDGLSENLNRYAPEFDRVLVRDGSLIESALGWKIVEGPSQFNFSGNVNLGWENVDPDHDVFFISDDVRLTQARSIETLRELAYSDENIGMLSPRVIGAADNPIQTHPPADNKIVYSERYIVFVSLYIKRSVLDVVGNMDEETFGSTYGWDDVDYSRRAKKEGFKLAVTPEVEVIHGLKRNGTETFIRNVKGNSHELTRQSKENAKVFFDKWGDNNKE